MVTNHRNMSPPRIAVQFLSLWIHSLDAIWRIGSSPTLHQYQWYTGRSNDPFWPDTQGTEVHGSSAIDFNEGRISSSVPKALIMEKVLITSAQMNGGSDVQYCGGNLPTESSNDAIWNQLFFFFINEYFLCFSSIVLMHICVVSSNYRTLLGRNPVYSGNQGCITGFGKQQMREEILVIQISPKERMQFW